MFVGASASGSIAHSGHENSSRGWFEIVSGLIIVFLSASLSTFRAASLASQCAGASSGNITWCPGVFFSLTFHSIAVGLVFKFLSIIRCQRPECEEDNQGSCVLNSSVVWNSQLLPRGAALANLLTDHFRHTGGRYPSLRIKLYAISRDLFIAMGAGK